MNPNEMHPIQGEKGNNAVQGGAATPQKKLHANIAYVFDDNYAPMTGVSITSLFENNKDLDEITVWLLSSQLSEENVRKFHQLGEQYQREIVIVDIGEKMMNFAEAGFHAHRGTFITYAKMFCVDYVSSDVKHLIYLDSDTIILGSIKGILELDGLLSMPKAGISGRTKDVLGYDAPYACDILIINAERWRNEHCSEKIIAHIKSEHKQYLIHDEGILNNVFRGQISLLPLEFNFEALCCAFSARDYYELTPHQGYTFEEISYAYKNPKIIHADTFLGAKPWEANTIHPNGILFNQWLEQSLWRGTKWSTSSVGVLYKVERWLYVHLPKRTFFRIWNSVQIIYAKKRIKQLNKNA